MRLSYAPRRGSGAWYRLCVCRIRQRTLGPLREGVPITIQARAHVAHRAESDHDDRTKDQDVEADRKEDCQGSANPMPAPSGRCGGWPPTATASSTSSRAAKYSATGALPAKCSTPGRGHHASGPTASIRRRTAGCWSSAAGLLRRRSSGSMRRGRSASSSRRRLATPAPPSMGWATST